MVSTKTSGPIWHISSNSLGRSRVTSKPWSSITPVRTAPFTKIVLTSSEWALGSVSATRWKLFLFSLSYSLALFELRFSFRSRFLVTWSDILRSCRQCLPPFSQRSGSKQGARSQSDLFLFFLLFEDVDPFLRFLDRLETSFHTPSLIIDGWFLSFFQFLAPE